MVKHRYRSFKRKQALYPKCTFCHKRIREIKRPNVLGYCAICWKEVLINITCPCLICVARRHGIVPLLDYQRAMGFIYG